MLTTWKNERGLTLLELMVAVVILVLVAVPLTSIGTTVYRWYKEDQLKNEAVLFAEKTIQEQKIGTATVAGLEATGFSFADDPHTLTVTDPENSGLQAVVKLSRHDVDGTPVPDLIDISVEVQGPDLEHIGQTKLLTTLETTVRKKLGVTP